MSKELEYFARKVASGLMDRRAFMGRAAALGASAILADTLLADAARAQEPKKGGHLKLGLGGGESSNSLDPALTLSQAPYNVIAQIGDQLVEVNPEGGLDTRIAEEFSSTPDAKVWSFKIRQGVVFHDGTALTSDDVLKTMQRHSDEKATSGALGIMKGIESMRAEGDLFEITLTDPNADLPYLMADRHLRIQPGGGIDDPANGIMSGPYRIVVDEPGVRHTFEKFADYWDDFRGHFDSTEILIINDATARMSALQSGQVQLANLIEPKIAELLSRAPGVNLETTEGRGQNVFVMHVDTAPFDNNDLRLALKYAVDREELVEKILRGYGTVGNDIPVNMAYPFFDESIPQREFDLDKAAEHYRKSGHDGSPIVLRVSDVAFPGAVDAAQLFQQSAQKAGIPLEIEREPGDGYWSEVWNTEAVLRFVLGREADAGPDVCHRVSVERGMERYEVQEREVRQPADAGAGRARSGQAQGTLQRDELYGPRRGRPHHADVQQFPRRAHRRRRGLGQQSQRRHDERSGRGEVLAGLSRCTRF